MSWLWAALAALAASTGALIASGLILALGRRAQAAAGWALAFAVGMVQGGTQALSRSLFGRMAPKAKSAEFFGFYDVSSKFAGIAGPAIFAFVGQLTGSSRLSIVSLIIFFIGGILLLTRVREEEGIRVAEEENRLAEAMALA